jgi:hypothetical protein
MFIPGWMISVFMRIDTNKKTCMIVLQADSHDPPWVAQKTGLQERIRQ